MKVFAQNEQRQRKAKQYFNLYERREKERVGQRVLKEFYVTPCEMNDDNGQQEEKRKKLVEEVKERHEWNEGISQRVGSWREYQKKEAGKRKKLTSDDMSGETDHDKVGEFIELIIRREENKKKRHIIPLWERSIN